MAHKQSLEKCKVTSLLHSLNCTDVTFINKYVYNLNLVLVVDRRLCLKQDDSSVN